MSKTNPFVRGTGRALTGAVITAVAVVAVLGLGAIKLPTATAEPPSIEVDTVNNAKRAVVCQGGYGWLGADTERSSAVIPTGKPDVTQFGAEAEPVPHNEGDDASHPVAYTAEAGTLFAAAQSQKFDDEDLLGLGAASCTEAVSDQWVVGGNTTLGSSTAVTVSNPGQRPATVGVAVFTENGASEDSQRAGVLVPAGESRSVSVNGLAPESEAVAVHVVSTGSAVTASISTATSVNILPQGLDVITSQESPASELVFPGLTSVSKNTNTDVEQGIGDFIRLLNTSDTDTTATLWAVNADGDETEAGTVELPAGVVQDAPLQNWPKDATALRVTSDQPLVGSGLGYNTTAGDTDFAWYPAAPEISADKDTSVAIVKNGTLVIANAGDRDASVTLSSAADESKNSTVQVPARSAVTVEKPVASTLVLNSDEPVHAGVRVVSGANIAAYPVTTLSSSTDTLSIYPK